MHSSVTNSPFFLPHFLKIQFPNDLLSPDEAYAVSGIESPENMEPISVALWELMDEDFDASPIFGEEEVGVGHEVSGEGGKEEEEEVTRIEESEDDELEKLPGGGKPSRENEEDGEYDEEYEEDLSWKEDSEETGSRSLASSSQDSTNESSDDEGSDFVEV